MKSVTLRSGRNSNIKVLRAIAAAINEISLFESLSRSDSNVCLIDWLPENLEMLPSMDTALKGTKEGGNDYLFLI